MGQLNELSSSFNDLRGGQVALIERVSKDGIVDQPIAQAAPSQTTPELLSVDEIWIIETIFYGTAFGGTYLRFELYRDGNVVRSYDFNEGTLISASEDGWPQIL